MFNEKFDAILAQAFEEQTLIQAILSSPKIDEIEKIMVRPLLIKGELVYQLTEFRHRQALHQNLSASDCQKFLKKYLTSFKQSFFYTLNADYQILVGKKENITILKKPASKAKTDCLHNRQKHYLLEEGNPIPFLIELEVMSKQGKVYPQKRDKFRQINRFLEMIEDVVSHLNSAHKIHIIDFGCGKAYLTFALYHYLKIVKGYDLDLIGLDLKEDVIEKCQQLARKLGYEDLQFNIGDINQYQTTNPIDMVISLHACDTATDAALEKAVRWQAKIILCVPCCQHELFRQIQNEELKPLLKHGILKERFAALVTDAARAHLLEILGYQTQVLEFIDLEHTPKNLLIRAIKRDQKTSLKEDWQSYLELKKKLNINPSLERRFSQDLF